MTGLDTNVLVRYIMQDDVKQAALAAKVIESLTPDAPGFVAVTSVVEFSWVMLACFELQRAQLVQALEVILRTKELVVERADLVWKALRLYSSTSADFADCLIERSASAAGCERTVTFDRGAAKHCGMTLVQ